MNRTTITMVIWLLANAISYSRGQEYRNERIVDAMLARAQCIYSGELKYRLVATRCSGSGDEVMDDGKFEFVFMGDSWILKQKLQGESDGIVVEQENITASHRDSYLEFMQVVNGKVLGSYVALEKSRPLHREHQPPPYFAGTFWRKSTIEYVRAKKGDVRIVGKEVIGEVPVDILELDVRAEDVGQAFYHLSESMPKNGGVLRMYAAERLRGALPRIEYVTRTGIVSNRFDAGDFEEASDGIFFPKTCRRTVFDSDGLPRLCWDYSFESVTHINQLFPESTFVFDIPAGTQVADHREPGRRGVVIPTETDAEALPLEVHIPRGMRQKRWLLALACMSVLVALAIYMLRSRKSG